MNNNNVLSFYTEFDDIRRYSAYKDFRDYFILKKQSRWRFLYKYLKVESFKECLKNGNIMFQEPYGWKDKFESRFYLADYRNVTSDTSTTPKMYATCFTRTKECEASWHVYNRSDKEKCVQIKIDVHEFRKQLLRFAHNKENLENTLYSAPISLDHFVANLR